MKKILFAMTMVLAATTIGFAQMKNDTMRRMPMHKTHKKYTCSMHPDVVRNSPGKCPQCGMKLVVINNKMKGKKTHKPMGDMKM